LPTQFSAVQQSLLTDPQTSGGLLVSCSEASVNEVMAIFKQHGFDHASLIGRVESAQSHGLKVSAKGVL
jgi:selenide,water dikinase